MNYEPKYCKPSKRKTGAKLAAAKMTKKQKKAIAPSQANRTYKVASFTLKPKTTEGIKFWARYYGLSGSEFVDDCLTTVFEQMEKQANDKRRAVAINPQNKKRTDPVQ
jgi:hypothetical protein